MAGRGSLGHGRHKCAKKAPKKKPSIWQQVNVEFRKLVCTEDAKYKVLRKKLRTSGQGATLLIVATIAAKMSVVLGVAAGLIAKFCALALLVLYSLGKEVFCRQLDKA